MLESTSYVLTYSKRVELRMIYVLGLTLNSGNSRFCSWLITILHGFKKSQARSRQPDSEFKTTLGLAIVESALRGALTLT